MLMLKACAPVSLLVRKTWMKTLAGELEKLPHLQRILPTRSRGKRIGPTGDHGSQLVATGCPGHGDDLGEHRGFARACRGLRGDLTKRRHELPGGDIPDVDLGTALGQILPIGRPGQPVDHPLKGVAVLERREELPRCR